MRDMVWKDEYYLRCYQLAKSGMGDLKIAKALGVTYKTFKRWKVKKRALRNALKDARRPETGYTTFKDFCYGRLSEKLQRVWDDITKKDTIYNTTETLDQYLREQGKTSRQELFLYALVDKNFNVTEACKAVCITRKRLQKWCDTDPDFGDLLTQMEIAKKDLYEGALVQGVKEGNIALIKFANSTINSDRGYGLKKTVEHTGAVDYTHTTMNIDDLDLSLEDRRKLLEAVRNRQEALNPKPAAIRDEEPEEGDEVIEAEYEVKG